jgi:DNA-directed RNA polymerase specialized sigma24 family protein
MHTPALADNRVLLPTQRALGLNLVTKTELLRLKAIARMHARGLPPDVGWEDLLQESVTRVLLGSRQRPEGVTTVAFYAGVMRSLKSEHWRRIRSAGRAESPGEDAELELRDAAPDPERAASVRQELAVIERLFAEDPVVLQIIAGLGAGLAAEQIRSTHRISKTEYDSARKRMRRALLRQGLTCEPT